LGQDVKYGIEGERSPFADLDCKTFIPRFESGWHLEKPYGSTLPGDGGVDFLCLFQIEDLYSGFWAFLDGCLSYMAKFLTIAIKNEIPDFTG
jgi:hypothetical protein